MGKASRRCYSSHLPGHCRSWWDMAQGPASHGTSVSSGTINTTERLNNECGSAHLLVIVGRGGTWLRVLHHHGTNVNSGTINNECGSAHLLVIVGHGGTRLRVLHHHGTNVNRGTINNECGSAHLPGHCRLWWDMAGGPSSPWDKRE